MPEPDNDERAPVSLAPGKGRAYDMGRIRAIFKADGAETGGACSISEWWLEPNTRGPGAHAHPEDDVFYVLEGTMSFLIGQAWIDAPRGPVRAGVLNLSIPGNFEPHMPAIVEWFKHNPPEDADA